MTMQQLVEEIRRALMKMDARIVIAKARTSTLPPMPPTQWVVDYQQDFKVSP